MGPSLAPKSVYFRLEGGKGGEKKGPKMDPKNYTLAAKDPKQHFGEL